MNVSYDPKKVPIISPALSDYADDEGLQTVYVICNPIGATPENPGEGVSFHAATQWLPRQGELLQLENGTQVTVARVLHLLRRSAGQPTLVAMVECVYTNDQTPPFDEP